MSCQSVPLDLLLVAKSSLFLENFHSSLSFNLFNLFSCLLFSSLHNIFLVARIFEFACRITQPSPEKPIVFILLLSGLIVLRGLSDVAGVLMHESAFRFA